MTSFRPVGPAFFAIALIVAIAGCSPVGGSGSGSRSRSGPTAAAAIPSTSAATSADPLSRLSALAIAQEALADTAAATSVHLAGTVTESGQTITLSETISHSGTQCSARYSVPGKGTIQIIRLGTAVWEKPDDTNWRSNGVPTAALPRVSGKWIQASTSDAGMAEVCDISKLFHAAFPASDPNLSKDPITALDGKVLSLELMDGPGGGSFYVTDTAHPLITRLDSPQYGSAGSIIFSGYGAAVTITAPPASEVVTLSQLTG